jgi:tetraprenyl-beta-curcumene synthase
MGLAFFLKNDTLNLMRTSVKFILQVRPDVRWCLKEWKRKAEDIPDAELRKQALLSIETKAFHCEGGAIYALLAGSRYRPALHFIIAYQTISDYLDNLCDRSNASLNPDDFRGLHESMLDALTPGNSRADYYRYHPQKDDGGYLSALVTTCQDSLRELPNYSNIRGALYELATYYCDIQVYKHINPDQRVRYLKAWFELHREKLPPMKWYEFALCAGSTLGIFCLIAQAFSGNCSSDQLNRARNTYFPWIQGLHILLDCLIDQEEDRAGGDLNFCLYYPDQSEILSSLTYFYSQANSKISGLANAGFHRIIIRGLLGIYLADNKAKEQKDVRQIAREALRLGGTVSWLSFFYYRTCQHLKI